MRCVLFLFAFGVYLNYTKAFANSCSVSNTTRNDSNYSIETDIIYDPTLNECECDLCVRKCCDANYILNYDKVCVYNNSAELKVSVFKYRNVMSHKSLDGTGFIYGWMKCALDNETYINPFRDDVYLQEDGRLWMSLMDKYLDYEHYCLDYDEDMQVAARVCINRREFYSYAIFGDLLVLGELISLPFLLVTFIVYAILPLKNFHGKSLMCYVFSLFGAYFPEVLVMFYSEIMRGSGYRCRFVAMFFFYFYIASFFWMNVMCIDIWLTFSGARGYQRFIKRPKRKRFLFYFVYAWGVPLVCIILILGISQIAKPHTWYNPGVVGKQCWINEGIPTFLYYNLPKVAVVIANIILFAATAWNIRKIQRDTAILRKYGNRMSKYTSDKQRYKVYFKLFLAMGSNTSVEVIAWNIRWQVENVPGEIWYIPELCNAAFGIFIFFIFVFKKSIWRLLRKRFCKKSQKTSFSKVMSSTTTSSMTTTNC